MSFEQLILQGTVGIGMGALIAVAGYLATAAESWNNRKFAYSVIIGVFTSFTVITGLGQEINTSNFIPTLLSIAGVSFFANKVINTALRVRGHDDELY